MDEKELTMEEAFARLNEILEQMEGGEESLEKTFALYEEGMKLVRHCENSIDRIEKKLQILEEEHHEVD